MHLRDPEPCSDLRLREIVLEAQAQDLLARATSAGRARAPTWPRPRRPRIPVPRCAAVGRPRSSSSASLGASSLSGRRALAICRASSTSSTLHVQRVGDLGGRGRSPGACRQLLRRALDLQRAIVQLARHAHDPRMVAEVVLERAHDRRHGIRGERSPRDRGRKRSIAFINANEATWTRSSYSSRSW